MLHFETYLFCKKENKCNFHSGPDECLCSQETRTAELDDRCQERQTELSRERVGLLF